MDIYYWTPPLATMTYLAYSNTGNQHTNRPFRTYEERFRHFRRLARLDCIALLALRSDIFADAVGKL